MSIISTKITSTSVLRGKTNATANALPVLSEDFNKVIDDLNTLDESIAELVVNRTASAIDATATATAAQVATGYITSTSAAATAITLPTAEELATELGASAGSSFEFIVDNTAGANTVTVIVGSGITAATPVITGGATLTVSVANAIGVFKIVWSSSSVAKLFRIG